MTRSPPLTRRALLLRPGLPVPGVSPGSEHRQGVDPDGGAGSSPADQHQTSAPAAAALVDQCAVLLCALVQLSERAEALGAANLDDRARTLAQDARAAGQRLRRPPRA